MSLRSFSSDKTALSSEHQSSWRIWFIVSVLGSLLAVASSAVTFTASLDHNTISLGESATLSLAFNGGQPDTEPLPAEVPNLQIVYLGPSSQFSVINGQVSSSVTYNFRVTPRQVGDYVIPPVSAVVGGQKLSTQPLQLKVQKASAPPPETVNSGSQVAFMRLALPKNEIYVGETIAGQLQLYLHSRVRNIGGFQVTSAPEGFNMGKMLQGQRRQIQISNSVYTIIPLNVALTAVKAGKYAGPITATAVLDVQTGNRRRDPFFEQFGMRDPFDMLGGGTEQQQVNLVTEADTVQLLPLPKENTPPTFNGAVGSYTMSITAGPTNVTAGDPVTVKVQISGRGTIENISLPEQPGWAGFKTFPPTSKVELTDQLGLQGTKTFEQIVSPENADIKALPPIGFSFFDPEQKRYRTLTQGPLALAVRPGGPVTAITAAPGRPQDNTPATPDIVPNKQRIGAVAQVAAPLALQGWFIALQGVPMIAFVATLVWRRRTESLARNPRLRRQKAVAETVSNGIARLRLLAKEKNSDEFFALTFRLLQEQIGERLDVPASAITESVVEEQLRPRGVPESVLTPLQELFQTCNLARYAPVKTTHELEATISKLEQALRSTATLKL